VHGPAAAVGAADGVRLRDAHCGLGVLLQPPSACMTELEVARAEAAVRRPQPRN
jgi:hypothetical protein